MPDLRRVGAIRALSVGGGVLTLDLDELEQAAEKATGGKWGYARADRNSGVRPWITVVEDGAATGGPICLMQPPEGIHALPNQPFSPDHQIYDNARYIALCSPDTILSLINRVRKLEKVAEALRKWEANPDHFWGSTPDTGSEIGAALADLDTPGGSE